MNKFGERLKNGIITENPTFVQILGMCPTLAVTTSATNGLGMGLSTTVILIMSNLMIAMLRKVIPNRVRIPAYIVIIASFVTIIDFLLQAYFPDLSESLGGYIKLIVVNCIILGRAEAYASKNSVASSAFDGLGMGLGFTVGLTVIGMVRELIGAGTFFGMAIPGYQPIGIFVLSPGAFLVMAFLIAFLNYRNMKKKKAEVSDTVCRVEDCMHCMNTSCGGKFFDFDGDTDAVGVVAEKEAKKEQEAKQKETQKEKQLNDKVEKEAVEQKQEIESVKEAESKQEAELEQEQESAPKQEAMQQEAVTEEPEQEAKLEEEPEQEEVTEVEPAEEIEQNAEAELESAEGTEEKAESELTEENEEAEPKEKTEQKEETEPVQEDVQQEQEAVQEEEQQEQESVQGEDAQKKQGTGEKKEPQQKQSSKKKKRKKKKKKQNTEVNQKKEAEKEVESHE